MQNTSHAVMAQRHEAHDSLEHFPSPRWCTRALCEHVIDIRGADVWEPACAEGHMAEALKEYARSVLASDVHDYGYGAFLDFLWPGDAPRADFIVTNPPFRLAEQFITRALGLADHGVAMLVRTVFLESVGRYERLFTTTPPQIVAQFVERVPMVKGRVDRHASTATSYCWLVWRTDRHFGETKLVWIPPSRARLERDKDYPA